MLFFYGWGTDSKVLKYGRQCHCPACNSVFFFNVVVQYSYFSLFFIPIIKWNKKYFLQCPNCGSVMPIDKQTYLDIKNGVAPAPAPAAQQAAMPSADDPFTEIDAAKQTDVQPASEIAATQPDSAVEPASETVADTVAQTVAQTPETPAEIADVAATQTLDK